MRLQRAWIPPVSYADSSPRPVAGHEPVRVAVSRVVMAGAVWRRTLPMLDMKSEAFMISRTGPAMVGVRWEGGTSASHTTPPRPHSCCVTHCLAAPQCTRRHRQMWPSPSPLWPYDVAGARAIDARHPQPWLPHTRGCPTRVVGEGCVWRSVILHAAASSPPRRAP